MVLLGDALQILSYIAIIITTITIIIVVIIIITTIAGGYRHLGDSDSPTRVSGKLLWEQLPGCFEEEETKKPQKQQFHDRRSGNFAWVWGFRFGFRVWGSFSFVSSSRNQRTDILPAVKEDQSDVGPKDSWEVKEGLKGLFGVFLGEKKVPPWPS